MLGTRLVALALVAALPAAASAAALCQKKSGAVVIRPDACNKKESPVDLSQFGAVGPQGPKGDAGPAGAGARMRAVVEDGDPPTFSFNEGFSSVTNPIEGTYCLTPSTPIDVTQNPGVVSVEWYHSSGFNLLAQVVIPVSDCPDGDYEVKTYFTDSTETNDISFVLVVP